MTVFPTSTGRKTLLRIRLDMFVALHGPVTARVPDLDRRGERDAYRRRSSVCDEEDPRNNPIAQHLMQAFKPGHESRWVR